MTNEETRLLSLVVSDTQRKWLRHYAADTGESISEIARRGIASELSRGNPAFGSKWLSASPTERGRRSKSQEAA